MKTGIIDVGGGYRGIYAAGVLDYCLEEDIRFDLGIGISAGSANLSSFVGRQPGRNYRYYTEFGSRKEYAGAKNFITKGSFIDLDYACSTLGNSDGEAPLDYPAFAANPMEYYVVATDARTGEATYFDKTDVCQDSYDIVKASCAIPFVCRPYTVGDREYFDGALSDPVPVKKAFEMGCDRVVLLLTKPVDFIRDPADDEPIVHMIRHKYPRAAESMQQRAHRYNEGVAFARLLQRRGDVLIIAPRELYGATTLTRDREILDKLYRDGREDGKQIREFLERK